MPDYSRENPADVLLSPDSLLISLERAYAQVEVHPALRDAMTVDLIDDLVRRTVVRVTTLVQRHVLDQEEHEVVFEEQFPRNWWQHLKEAHAPRWWQRRWPVQYTRIRESRIVRFEKGLRFPESSLMPSTLGKPVPYFTAQSWRRDRDVSPG